MTYECIATERVETGTPRVIRHTENTMEGVNTWWQKAQVHMAHGRVDTATVINRSANQVVRFDRCRY